MPLNLPFVQAFEQFIHESASGLRRKPDGTKLLTGSIQNYCATWKRSKPSKSSAEPICCYTTTIGSVSSRWSVKTLVGKRFIRRFSEFLRRHNVRSDNYLGFHFKHLKTFYATWRWRTVGSWVIFPGCSSCAKNPYPSLWCRYIASVPCFRITDCCNASARNCDRPATSSWSVVLPVCGCPIFCHPTVQP